MNENNDMNEMLEFRRIKEMLVKNAMTEKAAQRFEQMVDDILKGSDLD